MGDALKGKVAIVTGSGQGIGRAIALGLAAEGAKVVTNNRKAGSTPPANVTKERYELLSDEEKQWFQQEVDLFNGDAQTTAQAIIDAGGEATPCFADISDWDEAKKLVDCAVDTYGTVDILVNVAGSFGFANIDEMTEEMWDRVNRVKPKGYFNVMHFAIPHMKKKGSGRILNCASRAFMGDVIKHAEYCAANAGVVGLTRGAAIELWEFGITCNVFCPFAKTRAAVDLQTWTLTAGSDFMAVDMGGGLGYDGQPSPELLVPFLVYLCTDEASRISGTVFSVGGNTIDRHAEPEECKSMTKFGNEPWTLDEIRASAPMGVLGGYHSITDVVARGRSE